MTFWLTFAQDYIAQLCELYIELAVFNEDEPAVTAVLISFYTLRLKWVTKNPRLGMVD